MEPIRWQKHGKVPHGQTGELGKENTAGFASEGFWEIDSWVLGCLLWLSVGEDMAVCQNPGT